MGEGMNARAVDHDELFVIQVRALQCMYPQAHRDFQQWGSWSHDTGTIPGLTNHIKSPSFWDQYDPANDTEGYAEEGQTALAVPQLEVRAEAAETEPYDQKRGEEVDRVIHDPDYPAIFRRVIRCAYYFRIPEFQYARTSRLDPDNFVRFLEGALHRGA
jgi:hypothetical protein